LLLLLWFYNLKLQVSVSTKAALTTFCADGIAGLSLSAILPATQHLQFGSASFLYIPQLIPQFKMKQLI
jgi:hypothetical protein